jgi:hypothetical protein
MYAVFLISVLILFGCLGGMVWALCGAAGQATPKDDAE